MRDDFTTAPADVLSPQSRRLLDFLTTSPGADTPLVMRSCAIANVPAVALRTNQLLAAAGDRRRVACQRRPRVNPFGQRVFLGHWTVHVEQLISKRRAA
jgi:hypothetical protein